MAKGIVLVGLVVKEIVQKLSVIDDFTVKVHLVFRTDDLNVYPVVAEAINVDIVANIDSPAYSDVKTKATDVNL